MERKKEINTLHPSFAPFPPAYPLFFIATAPTYISQLTIAARHSQK